METNLRTLGPKETKVILSFREQGRDVVHAADIIDLLGSEPTARKVIRNLLRKGWLTRLVGGRYMLLPPEHGPENLGENNPIALAAAAVEPSYVGWWSAAAFHGFTTQKPMTVTVAVLRQMPDADHRGHGSAVYQNRGAKVFRVQKLSTSMAATPRSQTRRRLSVDCIDRPDLAGGPAELARIVYSAMGEIDHDKLVTAALAMKSTALLQRLGFLSDLVGKPLPDCIASESSGRNPQIPTLDLRPTRTKRGGYRLRRRVGRFCSCAPRAIFCRRCHGSRGKAGRHADSESAPAGCRRSGARDIGNVEIDVILTYLLQLFAEKGDHRACRFQRRHHAAEDGLWSARTAFDRPRLHMLHRYQPSMI